MNLTNISRMQSSVYLARMTNGMVKAGFTDNPRTRIERAMRAMNQLQARGGIRAVA